MKAPHEVAGQPRVHSDLKTKGHCVTSATSQRAWLNGFLAGLYSYAPAPEAPEQLRAAVLYGSQTGTAEGLARKFAKHLKSTGFDTVLNSLEGYVPATLAAEKYVILKSMGSDGLSFSRKTIAGSAGWL